MLLTTHSAVGQSSDSPVPLKQLSLEELSQVQVTATRKEPTTAFRTPAAINVITTDAIRRSGASTFPELLRMIPGLEVAQMDSSKWAIGSRGFQGRLSRSMLVLIDGRSVYSPLFRGTYWEAQDTLLEDIDRIEVIRGPGGTIWGSNAVNGVINIVTKSSRQTHGMLVSAGGGNVNQGFLNWRYGGGNEVFSYRVYGKGSTYGPQNTPKGPDYDDWRMGQIGFRTDWKPNTRDSITIQGDSYGNEAGQELAINSYAAPYRTVVDANGFFSGQNIMAAWQRALKSGSDLQFRAYYDRTDRQDLNYREVRNTFDLDFIEHTPMGRHELSWGGGVRISPAEYFQTVQTVDFLPHLDNYKIVSGFVQDDISLIPNKVVLTVGSKFEWNSYSGFNYQPSARIAWTPNDKHTIWGAVTRAIRTPSRIEQGFQFTALLQRTNPPRFVRLVGDGGFTNEQLIGYEMGYRNSNKLGFVSLALFNNRYSDLLSVEGRPEVTETSPGPVHTVLPLLLRNGIQASSSGGEITNLVDLRPGWRVRSSYSLLLLDAKRQAGSIDASTVGQLEGDTPAHKVVLQSFFDLPKRFEFDVAFRYISSIPNQKVPQYATADVRIGRTLGHGLELSLVGKNLFQPSHVEYGGIPNGLVGIKRSAFLKLTWSR
ncbi:MAG: TonB-dependent receptor [Bryobacteraceae bacterium]